MHADNVLSFANNVLFHTTYLPLITYYYFMNNVSMYRQGSELPLCCCEMPKFKKIWWPNALIYI